MVKMNKKGVFFTVSTVFLMSVILTLAYVYSDHVASLEGLHEDAIALDDAKFDFRMHEHAIMEISKEFLDLSYTSNLSHVEIIFDEEFPGDQGLLSNLTRYSAFASGPDSEFFIPSQIQLSFRPYGFSYFRSQGALEIDHKNSSYFHSGQVIFDLGSIDLIDTHIIKRQSTGSTLSLVSTDDSVGLNSSLVNLSISSLDTIRVETSSGDITILANSTHISIEPGFSDPFIAQVRLSLLDIPGDPSAYMDMLNVTKGVNRVGPSVRIW